MTENSFRLSNGAAVLAAQNEGLHSVSLAVVLPFCAHETAGVYHFVEHLFSNARANCARKRSTAE